MEGKFMVTGDISLLMRMKALFGRGTSWRRWFGHLR
jgi:hypothetical protein